jgi:hypothetical protein
MRPGAALSSQRPAFAIGDGFHVRSAVLHQREFEEMVRWIHEQFAALQQATNQKPSQHAAKQSRFLN